MTKHSLRPIAMCVMLAGVLPLLAPQSLSAQAVATQSSFGTVEGKALDSTGKALSNTTVRLRDVRTGQVVDTKQTDEIGQFTFKGLEPGNYVVEVVGSNDQVLAASRMLTLNTGESLATTVALPAAKTGMSILGMSAPVAAIVMGSAAAAGVLAVQSDDCVSPPCQ